MKQAFAMFAAIAAALYLADHRWGYDAAYQIGYGALTLMAALISATFLWLWAERATPLALGMAFSWSGAASVMGWWWVYNLMDYPAPMIDSSVLFLFLALYFVGALLHFIVVQRSLGLHAGLFVLPVAGATAISAMIHVFI